MPPRKSGGAGAAGAKIVEAADTVAAGAIDGAGAVLEAEGTARDVAAGAIGGAAAAQAAVEEQAEELGGDLAEQGDQGGEASGTKPSIERLERRAEDADFDDPFFAKGDLRDLMLTMFRDRPALWSQMNEADQRDLIAVVENAATTIVQKIAQGVAAQGRKEVTGFTLESLNIKDGLKAVLKGPYSHEAMVRLGDAQGKQILVSIPDAGQFDNQRGAAHYDPDSPPLFPAGSTDLAEAGERMKVIRGEDGRLEAVVWGNRRVEREGEADGEGKLVVVHADTGADLGEPTTEERTQFDFAADHPVIAETVADETVTANERVNVATGWVERREGEGAEWQQHRTATLTEIALAAPEDTAYRVNLKTAMVESLPGGADEADDKAWSDVRPASPDELAATREARESDFDQGGTLESQSDA
jgi:hypothetical protein